MSRRGQRQPEQLALDLTDAPVPETEPEASVGREDLAVEQLTLGGIPGRPRRRGRAGMVPSEVWEQLLTHEPTRERYMAKVHRRSADACWYWTGAISSTGHGKLKVGRGAIPATDQAIVVTAHVYGYQLQHGLIRLRPGEDLVIGHRCDEASCQNPTHWELIERAANDADYRTRRWRESGPLADVRGAHGRAVAIREAILAALAAGDDVDTAIEAASAAGLEAAPHLW